MAGPSHAIGAEQDLVVSEGPQHDLRAGRTTTLGLSVGEDSDGVTTLSNWGEGGLTWRDQSGSENDGADEPAVEQCSVEEGSAADINAIPHYGDPRRHR
jgi:hypothetical protein